MIARIAIVALAFLAIFAVAATLARHQTRDQLLVAAMVRGYDDGTADLDALAKSEDDAGYRWAERNSIDSINSCAVFSGFFRNGCQAWLQDEFEGDAETRKAKRVH